MNWYRQIKDIGIFYNNGCNVFAILFYAILVLGVAMDDVVLMKFLFKNGKLRKSDVIDKEKND